MPSGRERILDAAYPLFSRSGIRAVGVDRIVDAAGVAKMTLYRNFPSKDELALAYLDMREERWTRGWLWDEIRRRADMPGDRLLAIFDVFGEWFEREDFEGCSFINILLEQDDAGDPVRVATVQHLANIRSLIQELASDAGIPDPDAFSRQWHILMKGSIVSAGEGDRDAARRARELGTLLLERHGVPVSG
ncbi:MAG: TetR/AcrR family transcriptional regulator [Thermoleophilaceae bacterium]|nr:TetR/AcrR family transcriptional regulator [Thermoleophilaceae bacterium]